MNTLVDVRDTLGAIQAPTLVMHRRGDQDSRVEEGRYLAEHIPGARFVELPGADHFVAINADQILDEVAGFLAGLREATAPAMALGAVLALDGPAPRLAAARMARTPDGGTVGGPGVRRARELAARAGPGRLLVSSTVRDLVAGSGIQLVDAGAGAFSPALPVPRS